jgi:hypothetical protein
MFVSTDAGSIGFAPTDVVPSPLAAAPPSVVAGDEVHVWASGAPGAVLTIAQCGLPAPATLSGDCPVTVPLTLDATGRGAVTLRPVRTFPTSAGPVDCEITRCAVVSFDASGAQLAVVGLDVLRPSFLLDVVAAPAEGLVDGQAITVEVTANTTEPLLVGQCGVSITSVGSLTAGPCRDLRELTVPPNPAGPRGARRSRTTWPGRSSARTAARSTAPGSRAA